jgi:predicted nucleic acid-binding protein
MSLRVVDASPQVWELAVIELALERRAERVVLGDGAARRQAHAEGLLSVVGALGLLLAARLRAEIADLGREIDRLESHGFRASPQLVQRVLSEASER